MGHKPEKRPLSPVTSPSLDPPSLPSPIVQIGAAPEAEEVKLRVVNVTPPASATVNVGTEAVARGPAPAPPAPAPQMTVEDAAAWMEKEHRFRYHRVYDPKAAAANKRIRGSMYPKHIADRENAKRWKHLGVKDEVQAQEIKTRCEKLLSSDDRKRS